jgi:hypothetical protein
VGADVQRRPGDDLLVGIEVDDDLSEDDGSAERAARGPTPAR